MPSSFIKDPDAVLDYLFDWSAWLEDAETVSSHTVTVPAGITLDSSAESSGTVTTWLSGGTDGDNYKVTCQIVTSSGRTDERSIDVRVRER